MRHIKNKPFYPHKINIPLITDFFISIVRGGNLGTELVFICGMLTNNERTNMKPCNTNIQRVIDLANSMMELADDGDLEREDDGCGILFGLIRDTAYKIRTQAEKERTKHQEHGKWD